MSSASITTDGHVGKKILTGPELASWSRSASKLTKLCIGAAWLSGEIGVADHTITQIARVLGVKAKEIRAVAELTLEQRAALTTTRRLNGAKMSNGMLDDLVEQVGATRLWAAIDRATLPPKPNGGMNGNGGYHAA